jgi:hypothetical protein
VLQREPTGVNGLTTLSGTTLYLRDLKQIVALDLGRR